MWKVNMWKHDPKYFPGMCGTREHTQHYVCTLITGTLCWGWGQLRSTQKSKNAETAGKVVEKSGVHLNFTHNSQDLYSGVFDAGFMGHHGWAVGSKKYTKNTHYFAIYVNLSVVSHIPGFQKLWQKMRLKSKIHLGKPDEKCGSASRRTFPAIDNRRKCCCLFTI